MTTWYFWPPRADWQPVSASHRLVSILTIRDCGPRERTGIGGYAGSGTPAILSWGWKKWPCLRSKDLTYYYPGAGMALAPLT